MLKIYLVFCVIAIIIFNSIRSDAAPVSKVNGYNSPQVLPPKEGYVPVYIRVGETPLSKINPNLAEAFHESQNDKIESEGLRADIQYNDAEIKNESNIIESKSTDVLKNFPV